jgi:hypothetical protein
VSKRISLRPGNYVIIPSLFDKDKNMKFVLRVYYEGKEEVKNNQDETNKPQPNVNPSTNTNSSTNDYKQTIVSPPLQLDLNDRYNKWFFGGLNEAQIANVVKEAQAATDRLKRKL